MKGKFIINHLNFIDKSISHIYSFLVILCIFLELKKKPKEEKFKDDVEGVIKGKNGKIKDSEDIRKEPYDQIIKQLCFDMTDTLEQDHKAND